MSPTGYLLVLFAFQLSKTGYVVAAREMSIVLSADHRQRVAQGRRARARGWPAPRSCWPGSPAWRWPDERPASGGAAPRRGRLLVAAAAAMCWSRAG